MILPFSKAVAHTGGVARYLNPQGNRGTLRKKFRALPGTSSRLLDYMQRPSCA